MKEKNTKIIEQIEYLMELQGFAEDKYFLSKEKEKVEEVLMERGKEMKDLGEKLSEFEKAIKIKDKGNEEPYLERQKLIQEINSLKEKEKLVKTQKEYLALDTEKEGKMKKVQDIEEGIEKEEKEKKDLMKDLEYERKNLEEMREQYGEKEEELRMELDEIKGKLLKIEEMSKGIELKIDRQILNKFEYIVKNKNGVGIVPVINMICEGCNIAITPQVLSKIRKKEELVQCINCARILYLPNKVAIV